MEGVALDMSHIAGKEATLWFQFKPVIGGSWIDGGSEAWGQHVSS